MNTTVNVPTCNYSSYKLSSPYDTDLQLQFHSKLLSDFKNRDDNNNCSICQENMLELGYSSDLYNCSNCLGLSPQTTGYSGNYPILTQAWGCDTCATVVAPVSYYESSGTVAPPDKLELYLTDLTYKNKVDTMWFSASSCDKGTTIKNVCINPSISTFSINVPPQNQGPSNPQESASGLEPWMIALIVIASLIAVGAFIYWFLRVYKSKLAKENIYNLKQESDLLFQEADMLRRLKSLEPTNPRIVELNSDLRRRADSFKKRVAKNKENY